MIISQILGILAFLFYVFSIQNKKKKNILLMQLISNIFYALSYLILQAISAVLIDGLSFIRCLIYYHFDIKHRKCPLWIVLILVILSIVIGVFTVRNVFDAIPIIISIIYIISTWQDSVKMIYISFIITAVLWIIYNFYIGTYTPMIGNVFEIISGLVAMYRLKRGKCLN